MVIESLELTSVNPDQNTFFNVKLTPTLFTV